MQAVRRRLSMIACRNVQLVPVATGIILYWWVGSRGFEGYLYVLPVDTMSSIVCVKKVLTTDHC